MQVDCRIMLDGHGTTAEGGAIVIDATIPAEKAGAPIADNELKRLVHEIEQLAAQRESVADKIATVYRTAKAKGYDRKALHQVVRLRAQDPAERAEQDRVVAGYMAAVERAEQQGAEALTVRIPWPTKERLMAGR